MNKKLAKLKVSIILHSVFAAGVFPLLFLFGKQESLLFINGLHSPFLDRFMYHVTRLPELAMIVFVIILALFHERRFFLTAVVAMSVCGLSILLFKNIIFADFDRPFQWLDSQQIQFHRVEGIRLHSNGSFPSGHTMAAFCSLGLAGFISKSGWLQFFFFILAVLSAYSRVYTAQHYLMDIYAGALTGYGTALGIHLLFSGIFRTPYWNASILGRKKK